MSVQIVQGIKTLPEPTSVKAVRSFIGMVNYFRDYIPALSSHQIPLFEMTKKRSVFDEFKLSDAARVAFHTVKELLENSAELVHMTENDPFILYTDASTKAYWRGSNSDSRWFRKTVLLRLSHALRPGVPKDFRTDCKLQFNNHLILYYDELSWLWRITHRHKGWRSGE
jgi:hypothetical protein